jgi:N-acetylneuraminic acid mutarotase
MQKKSTSRSAFFNPRILICFLLCAAACSILAGTLLAFLRPEAPAKISSRNLTFAERVAYQRAIEDVYWRHRIWPKERPDAKPSLDAVMSRAQIEKKVAGYLRNSQALEDYWQRPITAKQLQAEMERMAQHTKQPDVLRELFAALGNDPFVIAECLARPALAGRLLTNWYAYDQRIHGELRQRAEADLFAHPTVEQMKQTSGTYSEVEMVKSDGTQDKGNRSVERGIKLNSREWDENVRKLAATGKLSPLQEDQDRYYATALLEQTKDRLKLATVAWLKEPLESWRARAENEVPAAMAAPSGNYELPKISDGSGCLDDTWTATSGPPDPRDSHTAVWTGNEMITWGGETRNFHPLNTGARYSPATDTWIPTNVTNAPSARVYHTAIWTGSEMIVWGGYSPEGGGDANTGGRYNPDTDTWTAMSTTNAPSGRQSHTAVWAGSEMIVWGGYDTSGFVVNTGGRYNAGANSWTATTTNNAPVARSGHTAVWTATEMIVWGGYDGTVGVNTGARYNPSTNSWTATSTTNVPSGRYNHTSIWTGSDMIIWAGIDDTFNDTNTGARYNPGTNSWAATATTNAPDARYFHTAVWTGNEMIVWGGYSFEVGYLNTGAKYSPNTNSWTATTTANTPDPRRSHATVWTGSEMIVWGGYGTLNDLNTGGRYNPITDSWVNTGTNNAPSARIYHTAVWTGSEMLVWGGENENFLFLILRANWSDTNAYANTDAHANVDSDPNAHTYAYGDANTDPRRDHAQRCRLQSPG